MRPTCAFIEKMPQKAAGIRSDPPPSVPSVSGTVPAATAAAEPELEPPVVRETSQGFRVIPDSGEFEEAFQPSSGVVFLPTMIAPAASMRSTTGAVSFARSCS
jgi:hypothetical protein